MKLTSNARLDHETARDWYESYGCHVSTTDDGDVILQAIPYSLLNDTDDDLAIVDQVMIDRGFQDSSRPEIEALVETAREIFETANAIEGLLDSTVQSYRDGDMRGVVASLREAARIESGHGDDPASRALREQLLAETPCDICGEDADILYSVGERDDGTLYERRDGSFGANDLHVCIDCLPDGEDEDEDGGEE